MAGRACSLTDTGLLRRKGHLKEQDAFIDLIRTMHSTHTIEEVMSKMDLWIAEHRTDPRHSRLRRLLPHVGNFFTPLNLRGALRQYDAVFNISNRKYIPPNFAEVRHIVNIAQVRASAPCLRLVTFDADGTLHADGHHVGHDAEIISQVVALMMRGVDVAIVTHEGYPGEPHKFEQRLSGLLNWFREHALPPEVTRRFFVMGGCNYLLRVDPHTYHLEFLPDAEWQLPQMRSWGEGNAASRLLDVATDVLTECVARHKLPCKFVRKAHAVGVVPTVHTIYEVLEDIALTLQVQIPESSVPFCACNSGNDVFVDIGNKSLGLEALMLYTGAQPDETLHVGDRFTLSGNDAAAREKCSVLWVASPEETCFFNRMLLSDMAKHRYAQAYIE